MHYCLSAIQILTLNAVFYMATLCWVGKRRGRKTKSLVIPREENWCINSSTPSNPPSHVMFPEARQGNLSSASTWLWSLGPGSHFTAVIHPMKPEPVFADY